MNRFYITYISDENKIYITCKHKIENVKIYLYNWETTHNTINLLYTFDNHNFNNNKFWYQITDNLFEYNGIKIEIEENGKKIEEEYIRFRTRYGEIIKKSAVSIYLKIGIGDVITCTPAIRKMSQIYNKKITIFTSNPEVFINNPYVENAIKIDKIEDVDNYPEFMLYYIFNIGNLNYAQIDHRQMSAFQLGFQLNRDELNMDFYPDQYIEIPELPEKFICINPSITYSDRTWSSEKWQKFITLIEKHIPVVAIGKSIECEGKVNLQNNIQKKYYHTIKINNGLNLVNNECQNSLSQAYHIINKSETFVTMNNGLYILSLCDINNHITQLGTPWNTENNFRIRNNIKDYNLDYVIGDCKVHCTSNLNMTIDEYGHHYNKPLYVHDFQNITPINNEPIYEIPTQYKDRWWANKKCYLGKSTYECHPTPEQVYESVLKYLTRTNKI